MSLRVVTHGDAGTFLKRAESWLLEHQAEYNLILGIAMTRMPLDAVPLLVAADGGSPEA